MSGIIVNNPASTQRRAFNVREFCAEYGIGHDNVYKAIREGKLVARKFGKRTIITVDDADRFIAALPRLELPPATREPSCPMIPAEHPQWQRLLADARLLLVLREVDHLAALAIATSSGHPGPRW